jgi:hypothetical protein
MLPCLIRVLSSKAVLLASQSTLFGATVFPAQAVTLPMHVDGSVSYLAVYEDQVVLLNSNKGLVSFVRYNKLKIFGSIGGMAL